MRIAESALGTGFRSSAARHGAFPREFCEGRHWFNIAGGCCGNTPEHISAIAKALEGQPPRKWGRGAPRKRVCGVSVTESNNALEAPETKLLRLSGSQPFTQQPGVYIMIGERTNVAGSPKFAKLV